MPTEKETLEAEIAELKKRQAEEENLEPLRREAAKLREWAEGVTKKKDGITSDDVTRQANEAIKAGAGVDLDDITVTNMKDPEKAKAAAAAIRKALAGSTV